AEASARVCLDVATRTLPDAWHRFSVMSVLGGALAAQRKFDQAERLLLEGYDGLQSRIATIPEKRPTRLDRSQLDRAGARIVAFYEATGNAEKLARWRSKIGAAAKAKS